MFSILPEKREVDPGKIPVQILVDSGGINLQQQSAANANGHVIIMPQNIHSVTISLP